MLVGFCEKISPLINPLSANSQNGQTQTIPRQFAGGLFECVLSFCGIDT